MLFTTETARNPPFIDLHTHRRNTASGVVAVSNFSQKDPLFDFGFRMLDVGNVLPKSDIRHQKSKNTEGSSDVGCRMSDVGNVLPKSDIRHPKSKNTEGSSDVGFVISDVGGNWSNPKSDIRHPKSVGLHPWFLTKENFENDFKKLTQLVDNQNIIAIGECGLDKLRGEDVAFQTKAFEAQIRLAQSVSDRKSHV